MKPGYSNKEVFCKNTTMSHPKYPPNYNLDTRDKLKRQFLESPVLSKSKRLSVISHEVSPGWSPHLRITGRSLERSRLGNEHRRSRSIEYLDRKRRPSEAPQRALDTLDLSTKFQQAGSEFRRPSKADYLDSRRPSEAVSQSQFKRVRSSKDYLDKKTQRPTQTNVEPVKSKEGVYDKIPADKVKPWDELQIEIEEKSPSKSSNSDTDIDSGWTSATSLTPSSPEDSVHWTLGSEHQPSQKSSNDNKKQGLRRFSEDLVEMEDSGRERKMSTQFNQQRKASDATQHGKGLRRCATVIPGNGPKEEIATSDRKMSLQTSLPQKQSYAHLDATQHSSNGQGLRRFSTDLLGNSPQEQTTSSDRKMSLQSNMPRKSSAAPIDTIEETSMGQGLRRCSTDILSNSPQEQTTSADRKMSLQSGMPRKSSDAHLDTTTQQTNKGQGLRRDSTAPGSLQGNDTPSTDKKASKPLPQSRKSSVADASKKAEKSDENSRQKSSVGQPKKTSIDRPTTVMEEEETYDDKFDVAKNVPKERISESESCECVVKLLRVLMYILIFLILLTFTSITTGAILLLEANSGRMPMDDITSKSQLLWIIVVPQVLVFLEVIFRNIFAFHRWPSFKLFCFVALAEALHSIGLAFLMFQILCNFSSFYALGFMNAVGVIPGLIRAVFRKDSDVATPCKRIFLRLFDVFAFCIQATAVILPPILIASNGNQQLSNMCWQLPLSLVLISLKWWETFAASDRWIFKLKHWRHEWAATRNITSSFTSVINIGTTIACLHLFNWKYGSNEDHEDYYDLKDAHEHDNRTTHLKECNGQECSEEYLGTIALCLVGVFAGMVAYYVAGLGCKLMMQRVSFALPLVLSTPLVIFGMTLQCKGFLPELSIKGTSYHFQCDAYNAWEISICCVLWLSSVWISRHIWCPKIERLAYFDRIFVRKMYCGPLLGMSLMLNRRDDSQYNYCQSTSAPSDVESRDSSEPSSTSTEKKQTSRVIPKVYACGTMWHETQNEMIQLLKSIMRMDKDQAARKYAQEYFDMTDPDYYEFEAHIFFDDCLDIDEDDKWIPNKFVIQFVKVVDEAASSVHKEALKLDKPAKTATPYGGRLTWTLPFKNKMIVHLKDKNKIRHRKRWSQVMYMYYLLGYRLFEEPENEIEAMLKSKKQGETKTEEKDSKQTTEHYGKSEIFKNFKERQILEMSNTYILALDGDVDFKPDAVRLLVDRLKANPKSGAACGRIHPIGSGPLVWYQKFEYAIGHWLQKSAEHVFGCVLCSPGCFSLFRGSALLDDNVMKRYTTEPTEASHYVQYDQGEDRWLCTLLLQQGYRVDYCAASDALTYAPENFNEFFNQRRRWTPSTMANIIDLLSDVKLTVNCNPNISYFYILYQFLLMVSLILGPSTIVLAIATSFQSVINCDLWQSYLLSVAPVIIYIIICFKCKTDTQLKVGQLLSAAYACVMVVVLVGILQLLADRRLDPSLIFLGVISAGFFIAGILHPYEIFSLLYGFMYFLCIPAGYLILIIYSLSNLHIVSWGTREVKKRKTKAQMQREKLLEEQKQKEQEKKRGGIFKYLRLDSFLKEIKDMINQAFTFTKQENSKATEQRLLKKMLKEIRKLRLGDQYIESDNESDCEAQKEPEKPPEPVPVPIPEDEEEFEILPDDTKDPNCLKHPGLGDGQFENLSYKEERFFARLIELYLQPIKKDAKKEKALKEELKELRTHCSFAFWFLNLLWILFNYMINKDPKLNTITVFGLRTPPIGLIFVVFFVIVFVIQIAGMIRHRWGTFLQLISITELTSPIRNIELSSKEAVDFIKTIQDPDSDSELPLDSPALPPNDRMTENVHARFGQHNKHGFHDTYTSGQGRRYRLDKELERKRRERERERRNRIPYHDALNRQISERFGHLDEQRGSGGERRKESLFPSDVRNSRERDRGDYPKDRTRHRDVTSRVERRLQRFTSRDS